MTGSTHAGEPQVPGDSTEEFVRLFTQCQRRIYWYVFALLHDSSDAEEVFQETALLLWQKFKTFEPGTNFVAWACRIAYNKALRFRDEHRREIPCFSSLFMEEVAPELLAVIESDAIDARLDKLSDCLGRLNDRDRDLIHRRYKPGATTKRVAAEVGRSTDAVYKALSRIHQALFDCMTGGFPVGREGTG